MKVHLNKIIKGAFPRFPGSVDDRNVDRISAGTTVANVKAKTKNLATTDFTFLRMLMFSLLLKCFCWYNLIFMTTKT